MRNRSGRRRGAGSAGQMKGRGRGAKKGRSRFEHGRGAFKMGWAGCGGPTPSTSAQKGYQYHVRNAPAPPPPVKRGVAARWFERGRVRARASGNSPKGLIRLNRGKKGTPFFNDRALRKKGPWGLIIRLRAPDLHSSQSANSASTFGKGRMGKRPPAPLVATPRIRILGPSRAV